MAAENIAHRLIREPVTQVGHGAQAATVEYGEYKERAFVRCVGDKIITHRLKPRNRSGREVRSVRWWPWWGKGTSPRVASRMSSRIRLAASGLSLAMNSQMLVMSDAAPGCSSKPCRQSFWIALLEQLILTLAQAVKESLAVDRLHAAALDVIVATIKHFAHFSRIRPRCHFFLPVKVLSRVFRGKFIAGLKRAFRE